MAKLTTEQQNELWDNRFTSVKEYNSETKDANTFVCYDFGATLDGMNYYLCLKSPEVTHADDAAAVESTVKSKLAEVDYKAQPVKSETTI